MRGRRPVPLEDDGLQADVMRFMAIIAFCLIAILALARQVEPEAASEDSATPTASIPPEPEPEPESSRPKPPTPRQALVTAMQSEPAPHPAHDPRPIPEPEPSSEAHLAAEPADDSPEGLVLRFASASDFLRLVNSGRLQVFAFSDDGAWRLHPGLTLEPASAPGALHELLPSTLPAAMLAALTDDGDEALNFRWGMRMPAGMEAQIRGHLRSATRGAMIIDRNGDVRHETDG